MCVRFLPLSLREGRVDVHVLDAEQLPWAFLRISPTIAAGGFDSRFGPMKTLKDG